MLTRSSIKKLPPHERIILAWDKSTFHDSDKQRLESVVPHVGPIKLGLQAIYSLTDTSTVAREAHEYVTERGGQVMLDAKLHDIENTVTNAMEMICWWPQPPVIVTIHANMRVSSIVAALNATKIVPGGMLVAGVTALTDHNEHETRDIYTGSPAQIVLRCAERLMEASHISGVPAGIVCSPRELRALNGQSKFRDLVRITPGIRPPGSPKDDQARTMEPHEAIHAGADYLVIGRPITEAKNMAEAAQAITAGIKKPVLVVV